MRKLDDNFDERLKKYSEIIKSMEIVYHEGRVKCVNKKDDINFRSKKIQDKNTKKKQELIREDEYLTIKNKDSLVLKMFLTTFIFIGLPFMANIFVDIGLNEFLSGIGSMFISYSIVSLIWGF